MSITRRDLLVGSAGLTAGASVSVPFLLPKYHFDLRPKRSRVAILNVDQYSPKLENILEAALQLFPIDVAGKTVLLKPTTHLINGQPQLCGRSRQNFPSGCASPL